MANDNVCSWKVFGTGYTISCGVERRFSQYVGFFCGDALCVALRSLVGSECRVRGRELFKFLRGGLWQHAQVPHKRSRPASRCAEGFSPEIRCPGGRRLIGRPPRLSIQERALPRRQGRRRDSALHPECWKVRIWPWRLGSQSAFEQEPWSRRLRAWRRQRLILRLRKD